MEAQGQLEATARESTAACDCSLAVRAVCVAVCVVQLQTKSYSPLYTMTRTLDARMAGISRDRSRIQSPANTSSSSTIRLQDCHVMPSVPRAAMTSGCARKRSTFVKL